MQNTIAVITFLGGGSLVASLIVQILKKALTGIADRWGALVTQAVLLGVSLLIAGLLTASTLFPESWLMTAGLIFTGAIALYEVLYKAVWNNLIKGNV